MGISIDIITNCRLVGAFLDEAPLPAGGPFARGERVQVTTVYSFEELASAATAGPTTARIPSETRGSESSPMIRRVGLARPGVVEVPLADLIPLHPVPRPGLPPDHVQQLASTIQANGYDLARAIPVARMPNGRLVHLGGHHRAEAMRQLGETTIPTRIVDWASLRPVVQDRWRQAFPLFPWDNFQP